MSIGAWEPSGEEIKTTAEIDVNALPLLIGLSENNQLSAIGNHLSNDQINQYRPWMKVDTQKWQAAVATLNSEQITHLIRFFTLAEMQLEGWEAGNDSPVIALNKVLKKRGDRLDKTMLMWIRQNSNNRFIPNGAL